MEYSAKSMLNAIRMVALESKAPALLTESDIQFMLENRIEFLKKNNPQIGTEHDPHAQHTEAHAIIDHFAEHGDPTKNKAHTQWIVGQYKKGNIRQEDTPRIHDSLSNFEKYKPKLASKDLNSYKRLSDVDDAVQPHLGTASTKAEKVAEIEHAGHEKVYEDPHIKVYHLKTEEASKHIYGGGASRGGTGTNWCTAARSEHNQFDHYHGDGPYHVVHRKSDGEVFQAHPASNQFMDRKDNRISKEDFESIKPSYHKFMDAHPKFFD